MKTSLLLLLLGGLALLASCVESTMMPVEPAPLEILYYEPEGDSLLIGETDSLLFLIQARGAGPIDAEFRLEDRLIAEGDSLLFRAWEHVAAQIARPDSHITLELSLSDSLDVITRSWELKILWGFDYFPQETSLSSVVGQTVIFRLGLESGGLDAIYSYHVNGTWVGDSPVLDYHCEEAGHFEIIGRVSVGEMTWTRSWSLNVELGDPVDPPATVTNLRAGPGSVPGNLIVAFNPPEDGLREPVHSFEIRAHTIEVDDWESAYLIAVVEKTPGALEERFDLPALSAGLELIVRVRSIGESGNASEWSERAFARVAGHSVKGTLLDFESGLGLEGVSIRYGDVETISDGEGKFFCHDVIDINEGDGAYSFSGHYSDDSGSGYGQWYDLIDSRAVQDSMDLRMGTFRPQPFDSPFYEDFYAYFVQMVRPPQLNFHLIRPHYPLLTYFPEYVNEGLDYAATAEQGMDIWESTTGLDFFERVDDPEDASLTIVFSDTLSYTGICEILEWDIDTLTPIRLRITLKSNADAEHQEGIYRVMFHELGHAIGFWSHSYDVDHCMNHSNSNLEPHPDEVRLARIIYHMEPYEDLEFLRDGRIYDFLE